MEQPHVDRIFVKSAVSRHKNGEQKTYVITRVNFIAVSCTCANFVYRSPLGKLGPEGCKHMARATADAVNARLVRVKNGEVTWAKKPVRT